VGALPPTELKRIMEFHADKVLRVGRLLKYLLLQLPEEVEEVLQLEVLTPAALLPLSQGTLSVPDGEMST
jgi:hypothetical protein